MSWLPSWRRGRPVAIGLPLTGNVAAAGGAAAGGAAAAALGATAASSADAAIGKPSIDAASTAEKALGEDRRGMGPRMGIALLTRRR
jgi:hypothetical protein